MSEKTITYWARVGKPVTSTYKQRYWKIRKDGVKQRYWKTVTRTAKRRVKVTRRVGKPRPTKFIEYVRTFRWGTEDKEYFNVDVVTYGPFTEDQSVIDKKIDSVDLIEKSTRMLTKFLEGEKDFGFLDGMRRTSSGGARVVSGKVGEFVDYVNKIEKV